MAILNADTHLLRPLQLVLYRALRDAGSVPIDLLHAKLYGPKDMTPRRKQQQLGPHISRLNQHLLVRGWRIEPGATKQTYRMVEQPMGAAKTEKPARKQRRG